MMGSKGSLLAVCCIMSVLVSAAAMRSLKKPQERRASESLLEELLEELADSYQMVGKEEALPDQEKTLHSQKSATMHHQRRKFFFPHKITTRDGARCKLDVVMLVDNSGSICNNTQSNQNCANMGLVQKFIKDMSTELFKAADTKIAAVSFSTQTKQIGFTSTVGDIATFVDGLKSDGNTVTKQALDDARKLFDSSESQRNDAKDVIIMVTDGTPNSGKLSARPAYIKDTVKDAEAATQSGIRILVVGVKGEDYDEGLLKNMSSGGVKDHDYFIADNFQKLDEKLASSIVGSSCNPEPCEASTLDVAILVDASGSICGNGDDNVPMQCAHTKQMHTFVNSLSNKLMQLAKSQIAIIQFNSKVIPAAFTIDPMAVSVQVEGIGSSGKTMTKDAVEAAMNMFNGPTAQQGAKKVMLILTDGYPQDKINDAKYMEATVEAIKKAQDSKVRVVVIGVKTAEFSQENIKELVPGGTLNKDYFTIEGFPHLDDTVAESIAEKSC